MSTRGAILRVEPDGRLFGRYHHFDAYPDGLGKTLWNLYHGAEKNSERFKGDLAGLIKMLIDDHPAGWSTINGADWAYEPGYIGFTDGTRRGDSPLELCTRCGANRYKHYGGLDHEAEMPPEAERANCYCHGDRSESEGQITGDTLAESWCEYAYVIDVAAKTMRVMASYPKPWHDIAIVDLDGAEPDWSAIGDEETELEETATAP